MLSKTNAIVNVTMIEIELEIHMKELKYKVKEYYK